MKWKDITENKKNIIFVGESGCGKTELALNCAVELAAAGEKIVNLIDMDQTKGVYRARDFAGMLRQNNAELICGEHFLDTPVVPPGVIRLLTSEEYVNVLDVGGNEMGAITMGQFSEYIRKTESMVIFAVNPFRILSLDSAHIKMMAEKIRDYGDFDGFVFAANPNMGEYTDPQTAEEGLAKAETLAEELGVDLALKVLPEWLRGSSAGEREDVIYIRRYLQYP